MMTISTLGFAEKRTLAVLALLCGASGLSACDYFAEDKVEEGRPTPLATAGHAPLATPAAPQSGQTDAGDAVALDLDGDGKADSVRIARVGHYVVDDPISVANGDGTTQLPDIDWDQDAVVVKFGSGAEKAVNFPFVRSIAAIANGNETAKLAESMGCVVPVGGQALLAEAEEGAMIIHRTREGLVAEACAE